MDALAFSLDPIRSVGHCVLDGRKMDVVDGGVVTCAALFCGVGYGSRRVGDGGREFGMMVRCAGELAHK